MKQGFTLIELLVVVLMFGILAAVALSLYQMAVEKSRAAEAVILSRTIADAERIYFLDIGTYAQDITLLDIDIPGTSVLYEGNPLPYKHKTLSAARKEEAGQKS